MVEQNKFTKTDLELIDQALEFYQKILPMKRQERYNKIRVKVNRLLDRNNDQLINYDSFFT